MRLSQSHLSLFEECPRKFQHVYLDQVMAPLSPDDQSRRDWGTQFHLMMQQRELGLSPLPGNPQQHFSHDAFQRAVDALVAKLPEVFCEAQSPNRLSEHRRILEITSSQEQPFLLSAVYDLVFFQGHQATIFDWKTYQKPKTQRWLAQHWQTRLYPFILVETTQVDPSHVSMVYWFVKSRDGEAIAPESITFPYDQNHHDETRRDILHLLDTLSHHLSSYDQGRPMPQIPEALGLCSTCPFALRCGRYARPADEAMPLDSTGAIADPSILLNIDAMAKISL